MDIVIPKGIREFMPEWIRETRLGHRDGSRRQYRHGNLHIREYKDVFVVHTDRFDPRQDPIKHLLHDAPEVIVGAVCGTVGGIYVGRKVYGHTNSAKKGAAAGLVSAALLFDLATKTTRRLKR